MCQFINKLPDYKCVNCLRKNYDIMDRLAAGKNVSSSANNLQSNKPSNNLKYDEAGDVQINPKNITNTKNDFYSQEKTESSSSNVVCLCYKFDDDKIHTLFNNNICRICKRNRLEKSIKKTEPVTNIRKPSENTTNNTHITSGNNNLTNNRSNLLNDLNKKLNALKEKDERLTNNYVNVGSGVGVNKPNIGIKTENVKYISDKSLNGPNMNFGNNEKKKFVGLENSKNVDSSKKQFLTFFSRINER